MASVGFMGQLIYSGTACGCGTSVPIVGQTGRGFGLVKFGFARVWIREDRICEGLD